MKINIGGESLYNITRACGPNCHERVILWELIAFFENESSAMDVRFKLQHRIYTKFVSPRILFITDIIEDLVEKEI